MPFVHCARCRFSFEAPGDDTDCRQCGGPTIPAKERRTPPAGKTQKLPQVPPPADEPLIKPK